MRAWILSLIVFVCVINASSGAGHKARFRCLSQSRENRTVELYIDRDEQGSDIKYLIGRQTNGRTCSYPYDSYLYSSYIYGGDLYERPLKIRMASVMIRRERSPWEFPSGSQTLHNTCGVTDMGNDNYKIDLTTAGTGKMTTTYDRRFTFKCHFVASMPCRDRFESSLTMKLSSLSTKQGNAVPVVPPPTLEVIGKDGVKKGNIKLGEPIRLRISMQVGEGKPVTTGVHIDSCSAGYGHQERLYLIKNGCSVHIRGVMRGNEGFVRHKERSTINLFVSDGPWFNSFRLSANDIKFSCTMKLCYEQNRTKCDKSCESRETTWVSVSRPSTENPTLLTTVLNIKDVKSVDAAAFGQLAKTSKPDEKDESEVYQYY